MTPRLPRMRAWRRRWVIPATMLLLALMQAMTVGAHAEYRSSTPANGATVATPPAEVVITFSKETSATKSNGVVTDGTGATVSTGWHVDLNERTKLSIALKPNLPNGIYTVNWTSLSEDDGHVVDGSFIFTVDPNAASAAAATGQGNGGAPWGVWIALFGLGTLTIVGGLFALRARAMRGAPRADAVEAD
jgi:methionine-rich copper-binding protein CopC